MINKFHFKVNKRGILCQATSLCLHMIGIMFHVCDSDRVVVVELAMNSINMVEVIMM